MQRSSIKAMASLYFKTLGSDLAKFVTKYVIFIWSFSDSKKCFYCMLVIQINNSIIDFIINDFMLGQRRVNQLDNFINNNYQAYRMQSPRNMPLANVTNAYFSNGLPEHKTIGISQRNISPNKITNTRKPMISPAKSPRLPLVNQQRNKPITQNDHQRSKQQYCSNENHRNKKAEYIIHIEDEDMFYCGVCATQAASQGFTVNRMNGASIKKPKLVPHYPNYANNKRYHQLMNLMNDIVNLEGQFKKKDPKQIKQHYIQQQIFLNDFYDQLVENVQKMRQDHLDDFRAEQMINLETSQIHYENLKMHMEDLNSAWDDIQETIQDVVERVQTTAYEQGMETYRNTLNMFQHKIQQFQDLFEHFTIYNQKDLTYKIQLFREGLRELWDNENAGGQPTKKYGNNQRVVSQTAKLIPGNTIKNVHEMLPKSIMQNCQGQAAFRNLFPEQQSEQRLPEASPQFKAF